MTPSQSSSSRLQRSRTSSGNGSGCGTDAPSSQLATIFRQTPSPSSQGCNPSSTKLSQSSSRPLHVSSVAASRGSHSTIAPSSQGTIRFRHAPRPQTTSGKSSTSPLQSLSCPSHVSGKGAPASQYPGIPFTQAGTNFSQAPVPQEIKAGRSSSISPSQSSSRPLHTSVVAISKGSQV